MKTIKDFANKSHLKESIIRAVVRQSGGWESFRDHAKDVTNHGADGGFSGFIYHTETVRFYNNNRADINSMSASMADDLGEGLLEMIQNFNCLGKNYSTDEIGKTLYGAKRDVNMQISNALAWFALEEVCRSYVDITEEVTT